MLNALPPSLPIHERFDLKGATFLRSANDKSSLQFDQNWDRLLKMPSELHGALIKQLQHDVDFLASQVSFLFSTF